MNCCQTAQSKVWVCGRLLAGIVGSNSAWDTDFFYRDCCVLSGRGLSVGLSTRLEESYRMWSQSPVRVQAPQNKSVTVT
jgi:hypothetical protein